MSGVEKEVKTPFERIFAEVLLKLHEDGRDRFSPITGRFDLAIFGAKKKFPHLMNGFEIPYEKVLNDCFYEFMDMGFLSLVDPIRPTYHIESPQYLRQAFGEDEGIAEAASYICDRL